MLEMRKRRTAHGAGCKKRRKREGGDGEKNEKGNDVLKNEVAVQNVVEKRGRGSGKEEKSRREVGSVRSKYASGFSSEHHDSTLLVCVWCFRYASSRVN